MSTLVGCTGVEVTNIPWSLFVHLRFRYLIKWRFWNSGSSPFSFRCVFTLDRLSLSKHVSTYHLWWYVVSEFYLWLFSTMIASQFIIHGKSVLNPFYYGGKFWHSSLLMGSNTGILLDKLPINFYQSTLFCQYLTAKWDISKLHFIENWCIV